MTIVLPMAILGLALVLRVLDPLALQELRHKVFDSYQRLAPRQYQETPVVVIDVDDASLERLGQWPWPRTLLARLTDRTREAGAATIAFDIVFAEPDRTSPQALAKTWPDDPGWQRLKELAARADLPDHDEIFAEAIGRMRTVVGFALTPGEGNHPPPQKAGWATAGDDPRRFVQRYSSAVSNLPRFGDAASGAGSLNVIPDSDGVVRRIPLVVARGDTLYPSLAAEALRVAQGASTYIVKASGASGVVSMGQATGVSRVKVGRFVVPTDAFGQVILHDTGPRAERRVPAWKVLEGDPQALARLRGAIAFVGTSAAGLVDLRATPLAGAAPGVELHAQVVEQALLQQFLNRPDWADGAELLFLVVLGAGIIGCFLVPKARGGLAAGLGLVLIGAAVWGSWHAFRTWDFLLDPVYPALSGTVVYLSASLLSYLMSEGERRRIRAAFSHYMAPTLVERLASDPARLKLGGENREITLMFCDIRGFTTISEQFDAEGLTRFINRFLTPMTDTIMESGGTIDKYMGDAIMAFWNAPLDDPDHGRNACRAALLMHERLAELNADLAEEAAVKGGEPVEVAIGVGLNTGICCVGNLGSERRFDYSALGDEVNLASRLEGQCKTYGVETVVGENTRELAPDFAMLELDLVRVKGKTAPARVYTLMGAPDLAESEEFQALAAQHDAMLTAYRAQAWAQARAALAACRGLKLAERLARLYDIYEERIASLETTPPGTDWDGVHVALTK